MAKTSNLKFPNKSHRKLANLPNDSVELAEFFGIMIGDGGINNPWQAKISLNSETDLAYSKYISKLTKKLFEIDPTFIKRRGENTIIISLSSTSIVDFLIEKGLIRGNKLKAGLKIPQWILDNDEFKRACLRGLIDTDGCLYIHVHKSKWDKVYKNIGLNFSSYSEDLISQVSEILFEYGIVPHISKRGTDIYLYKASAVKKYLEVVGTSNDRIISIYNKWRDRIVVECPRLESA